MIKKEINKEKVIEMYNSGLTMITIAKYFGFKSYGPVQKVLKKEGINLKLRIGSNTKNRSLRLIKSSLIFSIKL